MFYFTKIACDDGIDTVILLQSPCKIPVILKVDRSIGEFVFLRKFLKSVVSGTAFNHADPYTAVVFVVSRCIAGIPGAYCKYSCTVSDRFIRKGKLSLPFRRFLGRSEQVDLSVSKHLQHIGPALVISYIFIVPVVITGHVLQIFISIPAPVSAFVHHMIAGKGKISCFYFAGGTGSRYGKACGETKYTQNYGAGAFF